MKQAVEVIKRIRYTDLEWKPGKGEGHLNKRKIMGHIPQDYTLDDYNNLIKSIVNDNENEIYLYYKITYDQKYFAFGDYKRNWEVIIGENGIMETAYEIIDMDYEQHFQKQGYYFLGMLKEVVNFDRTNEKNK